MLSMSGMMLKNQFPYARNFSVLKSDPNLQILQHPHTDTTKAFTHYDKRVIFTISMIIGIEYSSFVDVLPESQTTPQLVPYYRRCLISA